MAVVIEEVRFIPIFVRSIHLTMLYHSVFFQFKEGTTEQESSQFLAAAKQLSHIPGVLHFICLRQTSTKNNFTHGLAMQFAQEEDYAAYTIHSAHQQFITDIWIPRVADFLEIDYTVMPV